MSRIRVLIFTAAALLLSVAAAALPPHYQRLNELNAVLNHAGVVEAFGIHRMIDAIERVDVNLYRVSGRECHLFVRLVGIPSQEEVVGPWQFEVVPGELQCT